MIEKMFSHILLDSFEFNDFRKIDTNTLISFKSPKGEYELSFYLNQNHTLLSVRLRNYECDDLIEFLYKNTGDENDVFLYNLWLSFDEKIKKDKKIRIRAIVQGFYK